MTDKQRDALLLGAMSDLRKTTEGYRNNPNGINWRQAMGKLQVLHVDLAPSPVPALGPVIETGSSSMLIMSPTHMTSGVGYPAFDTGFGQAGRWVIAWEPITITKDSSAPRAATRSTPAASQGSSTGPGTSPKPPRSAPSSGRGSGSRRSPHPAVPGRPALPSGDRRPAPHLAPPEVGQGRGRAARTPMGRRRSGSSSATGSRPRLGALACRP